MTRSLSKCIFRKLGIFTCCPGFISLSKLRSIFCLLNFYIFIITWYLVMARLIKAMKLHNGLYVKKGTRANINC